MRAARKEGGEGGKGRHRHPQSKMLAGARGDERNRRRRNGDPGNQDKKLKAETERSRNPETGVGTKRDRTQTGTHRPETQTRRKPERTPDTQPRPAATPQLEAPPGILRVNPWGASNTPALEPGPSSRQGSLRRLWPRAGGGWDPELGRAGLLAKPPARREPRVGGEGLPKPLVMLFQPPRH